MYFAVFTKTKDFLASVSPVTHQQLKRPLLHLHSFLMSPKIYKPWWLVASWWLVNRIHKARKRLSFFLQMAKWHLSWLNNSASVIIMSDTDVLMIVKIVLVQRIISLDGYVTFSLKNIYQVIKVTINNYIMIM